MISLDKSPFLNIPNHLLILFLQSAKVYKRYSSVIPSSHILGEVQEVKPGTDKTDVSSQHNGVQTANVGDDQRTHLIHPNVTSNSTSTTTSNAPPKVHLRPKGPRQVYRPISMPLERLPTPAQINERNFRNGAASDTSTSERDSAAETIQEIPEMEKTRAGGSSRVSAYYITPFIDTQTMQRRTWDKKYKHYDVTPRTAMIVANSAVQPIKATMPVPLHPTLTADSVASTTTSLTTALSTSPQMAPMKLVWTSKRETNTDGSACEASSSEYLPLTLRAPRTLHPPPGTFYRPPASLNKTRTLTNWTTTVTTTTATTTTTSAALPITSSQVVNSSPTLTSPPQTQLQTQDSTDSGFLTSATLSPSQSPSSSSPNDLNPCETKPLYQRLRPRRMQELEHREAHFV